MDINLEDERITSLEESERIEVIDVALNAWAMGTALDVADSLQGDEKAREFILQHIEMIDYVAGQAAHLLEVHFTPPPVDALTVATALTDPDVFADHPNGLVDMIGSHPAYIEACVGRIAAVLGTGVALIYEDVGYRHLDEETTKKVRDIDEQLYLDVLQALHYQERKEYHATQG
jgi:hypothetical protein